LNSYRFIGAFVGGLFIQGLALMMVQNLGEDNESVIHCDLNSNQLIINEVNTGTAKVTITAEDPDDGSVSQDFLVKIFREGENPPYSTGELTEISVEQGFGILKKDISGLFKDPDNDELELKAISSSGKIIDPEIENETLILEEKGFGNAVITLSATDETQKVATQDVVIKINEKGNRPPIVKDTIEDKKYRLKKESPSGIGRIFYDYQEEIVDLDSIFYDPDDNELFYSSTTDNASVASATVIDNKLYIKQKTLGEAVITIAVNDGSGGMQKTDFTVRVVDDRNLPPKSSSEIDDKFLQAGFQSINISLPEYFTDLDGASLSYSFHVNNDAKGFKLTMAIFGLMCVFLFMIGFATTRERVQPISKERTKLKDDLKDLSRNMPWIILFLVSLITLIYVAIRSAVIAYYFRYYLGEPGLTAAFLVVGSVTIILALPFTKWLTKKLDKRLLYIICMLLVGASISGYYFTKPDDIPTIFLLQVLQSLGSAPTMPLLWSMLADSADYSEYKTGRKAMGLTYSASTLAQKVGFGLGGAIALWLLAFYGYQPGVEQSESSLYGMKMMMSIYPAAGAVICAILIGFYKLDSQTMEKVEIELKQRRELAENSE
jgi:GPH family glycoside/pentoside/hexuronide:cation symporter